MRAFLMGSVAALAGGMATAQTEITVWSWNIAAASLVETAKGFMASHPDITVKVEDLGNQQVFDKLLAGCAAGGAGLPDVVSIENHEAEIFWSRFPGCFVDLNQFGYGELAAGFPDFKRTELEVDGAAYAMPWDSGPVAMFYRRDFYEKAGVDPAALNTWDDFLAAGLKVQEANPGVVMTMGDFNGDTEWFRMLANEQGCGYFSADGSAITVAQPACVAALEKIGDMHKAGIMNSGDWGEKIQANTAGTVATQIYGGWYEGSVRTNSPDLAGKWGVYRMPSVTDGGARAANLGGSSLAITSASGNPQAAYDYVAYSLGTNEGQVAMLKAYGLVPSLLTALEDPYVSQGLDYWGGQAVWQEILATLPDVKPSRGTPFFGDADSIMRQVQTQYLGGGYGSAEEALDDAAQQIMISTGLPVAD